MADNNTIKTFTAADIEKYHKGLLSSKEMHDLEKAAMDDPFLADAMEGYADAGINVTTDIAELKKRLTERTTATKVVPMASKPIPWLRIAAMIILVAGAGFLVYQFGFNNKKENTVAENNAKDKEQPSVTITDSNTTPAITSPDNITTENANNNQPKTNISKPDTDPATEIREATGNGSTQRDTTFITTNNDQPIKPSTTAPLKVDEKKKDESLTKGAVDIKNKETKPVAGKYKDADGDGIADDKDNNLSRNNNGITANEGFMKKVDTRQRYNSNIFRGQVMDNNNRALPFANITNTRDNVGTYSDANGYFTLTSPDSVLDVQVRSLGYNNYNYRLRNIQNNQVVLQEDNPQLAEVVVSNKKINSSRSRTSTMVLEEPEPVDGWENYDTYLANNLNMPDDVLKTKQVNGGEVELSFEVDKNGKPVNITVNKSLCESCDKEAIRLVKEGPKFKRKAKKKSRTIVTVSF